MEMDIEKCLKPDPVQTMIIQGVRRSLFADIWRMGDARLMSRALDCIPNVPHHWREKFIGHIKQSSG